MSTQTRVLRTDDPSALGQAIALLRSGELVAFPTDTVYGLGCDLWQEAAIVRLYRAKERPANLAIPVLVSSPEQVDQVATKVPEAFARVAERFWPGGLTIILRRQERVPQLLCAGGDTIAVRMPDYALVRALANAMGGALATTSANLSGRPSPATADEVLADLQGRIPLLLDGGRCSAGVASSIIDLVSDPPRLLRAGPLSLEVLRECVPGLQER